MPCPCGRTRCVLAHVSTFFWSIPASSWLCAPTSRLRQKALPKERLYKNQSPAYTITSTPRQKATWCFTVLTAGLGVGEVPRPHPGSPAHPPAPCNSARCPSPGNWSWWSWVAGSCDSRCLPGSTHFPSMVLTASLSASVCPFQTAFAMGVQSLSSQIAAAPAGGASSAVYAACPK